MILNVNLPADKKIIELIKNAPLQPETVYVLLECDTYIELDKNQETLIIWF